MIETAQYADVTRSVVQVAYADGSTRFVPVDERNADYRALVASGVTISPPPA